MSADRKQSVALSEEQAGFVREAVNSGDYDSAEDVIAEALSLWRLNRQADTARLRALWDEGIASGEPQAVDFDELRQEARLRLVAAGHGQA